jgi:hypothetical protein
VLSLLLWLPVARHYARRLRPLLTACCTLAGMAGLPSPAAAVVAGLQQQLEGLVASGKVGLVLLAHGRR